MADLNVTIADLRTRITFQEATIAQGDSGAQVPSWANVTSTPTVSAKWVNAHGNEYVSGEAVKASQRATVTVRYRSDVTTAWRVVNGTEAWQIISIDQVRGQRRWTELIVERVKGSV